MRLIMSKSLEYALNLGTVKTLIMMGESFTIYSVKGIEDPQWLMNVENGEILVIEDRESKNRIEPSDIISEISRYVCVYDTIIITKLKEYKTPYQREFLL